MGKYEEVEYIRHGIQSMLRLLADRVDPIDAIAEHIYHRELGWKKIIQCLLAAKYSGAAEISLEEMGNASGKVVIRNTSKGSIEVGAGRLVYKATR